MIKKNFLAPCIFVFMMFLTFSVYAQNIAKLSVITQENTTVGERIKCQVYIDEATFAGGEFSLKYDKDLLKIISGDPGDKFSEMGITPFINTEYSDTEVYFTFANTTDINFNGLLAEFEFETLKEGVADFKIVDCGFSDYDLNDLIVEVNTASCNITAKDLHENIVDLVVTGGAIYFDTDSAAIVGGNINTDEIYIPDEINGIKVESIKEDAFAYCKSLTKVYCIRGSAADNIYLYPQNTEIVYIDEVDVILGDVNGDEQVDSKDAAIVLQHSSGASLLEGREFKAADVNQDGAVDSKDASIILQYTSGYAQVI